MQVVRRLLERRLGIFPGEARLELASWLWQEGVFEVREGDTVVLSTPEPSRARVWLRGGGLRSRAASAAFVHVEPALLGGAGLDGLRAASSPTALDAWIAQVQALLSAGASGEALTGRALALPRQKSRSISVLRPSFRARRIASSQSVRSRSESRSATLVARVHVARGRARRP